MNDEVTVVFVHGAGTGSWIWRRLQDSISLPSLAVEVASRRADATPASCADRLAKDIDEAGVRKVALVLHSLAGVLASEIAARLGERLVATVFVAAVVPRPGKRFIDAMGFPNSLILKVLFKINPQGLKPSKNMLRRELCNDLSEADAAALLDRYEAEWPGLYLSRIDSARNVPQPAYIRLTSDRSILPKLQDRMLANLEDPLVLDLATGHMAMLSNPEELGKMVIKAIQSIE